MSDDAIMTVSHHGTVVGTLIQQRGTRRLTWLHGADPRLASYAGTLDDDVEVLADRLATRLGATSATEAGLAVVSLLV